MKNKYIFVLSFISFLIISCSNLMDAREETPAAYTVSGKLVTEYESNVGPRSAFPANNIDLALYTTNFYYKSSPTATERTLCGTTTDSSFELKLPSLGTYYLEAESYLTSDGTKTVALKTTSPVELTLTEEAPFKNNVRMFLKIIVNTSGEGSIDLYMKSFDTSKVVTMEIYEDNEIISDGSFIFSNGNDSTVNWQADNVGAGAHTYTFKFYSDSSSTELVYQCTETVTVLPNKTTDTWVNNGNAEYFTEESFGFSTVTVMKITQTCLDNFALTNLYVDPAAEASGNGCYFAPVKTLEDAVRKCTDATKNYTINIMGDIEVNSGFTVSKNITIQKASGASSAKIQYSSTSYALFKVLASNTLKISNIDIEGPNALSYQSGGAAIYNEGTLILNNVKLSKFMNGSSGDQGGCLYNAGEGTISITGGSITSCASNQGGAIYNAGIDIEIKDCTISGCTAQTGGAIYLDSGKCIIDNSSFIDCLSNGGTNKGGAIYHKGTELVLKNAVSINSSTNTYSESANNIYLQNKKTITVDDSLSKATGKDFVAYVTPYSTLDVGDYVKVLEEVQAGVIQTKYDLFKTTNAATLFVTPDGGITNSVLLSLVNPPESNSITVYSSAELNKIASWVNSGASDFSGKTLTLNKDITIQDDFTPIGTENHPFKGTFEGNNKKVIYDNVTPSEDYFGIVGYGNGAKILNVNTSGSITLTEKIEYVGSLAGRMKGYGLIENCVTSVTITEQNNNGSVKIGGIVGCVSGYTDIISCLNTAVINTKANYVGGIIGQTYETGSQHIKTCSNSGSITGVSCVGGILGASANISENTMIDECNNTGNISGNECVGGIAGLTRGIDNSSNSGNISGNDRVGGIAGQSSTIIDCFSQTGTINGVNSSSSYIGGIVGYLDAIYDSEYDLYMGCKLDYCYSDCNLPIGSAASTGILIGGGHSSGGVSDKCYYKNNSQVKGTSFTLSTSQYIQAPIRETNINNIVTAINNSGKDSVYKNWKVENNLIAFAE